MIKDFKYWSPISLYMVCSYAYYQCNESLISDADYDKLCKDLLEDFDEIMLFNDHPHKNFLTKDNLKAGTGFNIINYPLRVISVAERFIKGGKESWEQKNQHLKKVVKETKNASSKLEDFFN